MMDLEKKLQEKILYWEKIIARDINYLKNRINRDKLDTIDYDAIEATIKEIIYYDELIKKIQLAIREAKKR